MESQNIGYWVGAAAQVRKESPIKAPVIATQHVSKMQEYNYIFCYEIGKTEAAAPTWWFAIITCIMNK